MYVFVSLTYIVTVLLESSAQTQTCDTSVRIECGYSGITPEQCQEQGCCWLPDSTLEQPWCVMTSDMTAEGSVRLFGGSDHSNGRLELYHAGSWGTICDDFFSAVGANVACRELGFLNGTRLRRRIDADTDLPIWFEHSDCRGDEEHFIECGRSCWTCHNCDHGEDVVLQCYGSNTGTEAPRTEAPPADQPEPVEPTTTIPDTDQQEILVRIVDGGNGFEGRVEVYHDGQWGTVCDDDWNHEDAQVVCRQLGLSGGEARGLAFFGSGVGPILLDSVGCIGDESNLGECSHDDWGSHDCTHREDAGVVCETGPETTTHREHTEGPQGPVSPTPTAPSVDITVRLANGFTGYQGRVEIYHGGEWGTVCDDLWGHIDAEVVCRQLGMSGGVAGSYFGSGLGPIWLDSVQCNGDEAALEDCSHDGWGIHDCSHNEDAGVFCEPGPMATTSTQSTEVEEIVRLVGGPNIYEGRVEVYHDSQWGTVCDDRWGHVDAEVVCHQLGMSGGVAMHRAYFGRGSGPILLDSVECSGQEATLDECGHDPWGVHDCTHSEDAGVFCEP